VARNFCILILLFSHVYASENFWFSYKITTQKNMTTSQQRNISPVMVYKKNDGKKFLCRFFAKKTKEQSTYSFLKQHISKLIDCFYNTDVKVVSYTQSKLKSIQDSNELIIIPVKFTVDFKDEFANIYLFNESE
jgi:flagellar motility protein FlgQ